MYCFRDLYNQDALKLFWQTVVRKGRGSVRSGNVFLLNKEEREKRKEKAQFKDISLVEFLYNLIHIYSVYKFR